MTLTLRPLIAALAITLLISPVQAKKMASAPPPPAACSDFYGNVNTPWLRSNPLPPGYASRSLWDEMNELSARQRESLFSNPLIGAGPAQDKLNALMQSADDSRIKADSGKVLTPLLAAIDQIKKPKDVANIIATLHARGLPVLFDYDASNDSLFSANATGLPELAFYTDQNPAVLGAQVRYRTYIENQLVASGMPSDKASTQASQVLGIELQLAALSGPSPSQIISVKDATKQYGNLQFANFLQTQKNNTDTIILAQPTFFKAVNGLINPKSIENWKSYLRFHVINQLSPFLDEPFFSTYGQFYQVYLEGLNAPRTHAQALRSLIETSAPELIAAAYSERYMQNGQRERARSITDSILQATQQAIARSTWIVDKGNSAILKTLQVDIGRDTKAYSSIEVSDSLAISAVKLLRRQQSMLRKAPASNAWPSDILDTAPLLVYIPADNRIIISSALLQAPVFDLQNDAINYGAFGALFSQQLSLALYQAVFKNVTAIDSQRLSIIAQYNGYSLSGNKKVNGTLTSTQNLADLSGVELSLQAFLATGSRDLKAQQDFFKAWATIWARVDSDASLLASYDTDIHAPAKWRANGPLTNMPAFGSAFSCKAGPMQRPYKTQLRLWP